MARGPCPPGCQRPATCCCPACVHGQGRGSRSSVPCPPAAALPVHVHTHTLRNTRATKAHMLLEGSAREAQPTWGRSLRHRDTHEPLVGHESVHNTKWTLRTCPHRTLDPCGAPQKRGTVRACMRAPSHHTAWGRSTQVDGARERHDLWNGAPGAAPEPAGSSPSTSSRSCHLLLLCRPCWLPSSPACSKSSSSNAACPPCRQGPARAGRGPLLGCNIPILLPN